MFKSFFCYGRRHFHENCVLPNCQRKDDNSSPDFSISSTRQLLAFQTAFGSWINFKEKQLDTCVLCFRVPCCEPCDSSNERLERAWIASEHLPYSSACRLAARCSWRRTVWAGSMEPSHPPPPPPHSLAASWRRRSAHQWERRLSRPAPRPGPWRHSGKNKLGVALSFAKAHLPMLLYLQHSKEVTIRYESVSNPDPEASTLLFALLDPNLNPEAL